MFAVTERLLLRPGWAEDAPALADALNDARIVRNLSRVPFPYTLDDAKTFLALPQEQLRPRFLIFRRDDGRFIGGIGLSKGPFGAEPNLGYWIARQHWHCGYATEAGRAVLALADASLRLARVVAGHMLDNPASGRVLAKLGFQTVTNDRLYSVGRGTELEVRHFVRDRAGPAQPALAA